MKIKKYTEENEIGTHLVVEQSNGITIKILEKPSEKYKEKMKKHSDDIKKKQEEKSKKQDQEKLINDRMREIAIRELKQDGKL